MLVISPHMWFWISRAHSAFCAAFFAGGPTRSALLNVTVFGKTQEFSRSGAKGSPRILTGAAATKQRRSGE
jgi:hypothetical protein